MKVHLILAIAISICGDNDESRKISHRTFHALGHSFTSGIANAGVAPELRMKLTGHSSERVHQRYTHHELEVLKAAMAKLPSLNS